MLNSSVAVSSICFSNTTNEIASPTNRAMSFSSDLLENKRAKMGTFGFFRFLWKGKSSWKHCLGCLWSRFLKRKGEGPCFVSFLVLGGLWVPENCMIFPIKLLVNFDPVYILFSPPIFYKHKIHIWRNYQKVKVDVNGNEDGKTASRKSRSTTKPNNPYLGT